MTTENALVPSEHIYLGAITLAPEQVVETATRVATALKKVVMDRRLFSSIQGKEYVRVEGWTTLGAMLGVLPREVETKRLEDGSYEAKVDLVRSSDGMVIGGASALCGMDETKWASKPDYARRSMAVTRATGKAYRLGFSWIMELAGYASTPAEEMDFIDAEAKFVAPTALADEHGTPARVGAVANPATNGTKAKSETVTEFWQTVKDQGLSTDEGKRALAECNGDFEEALRRMQKAG
jgi:hypothetical protein